MNNDQSMNDNKDNQNIDSTFKEEIIYENKFDFANILISSIENNQNYNRFKSTHYNQPFNVISERQIYLDLDLRDLMESQLTANPDPCFETFINQFDKTNQCYLLYCHRPEENVEHLFKQIEEENILSRVIGLYTIQCFQRCANLQINFKIPINYQGYKLLKTMEDISQSQYYIPQLINSLKHMKAFDLSLHNGCNNFVINKNGRLLSMKIEDENSRKRKRMDYELIINEQMNEGIAETKEENEVSGVKEEECSVERQLEDIEDFVYTEFRKLDVCKSHLRNQEYMLQFEINSIEQKNKEEVQEQNAKLEDKESKSEMKVSKQELKDRIIQK